VRAVALAAGRLDRRRGFALPSWSEPTTACRHLRGSARPRRIAAPRFASASLRFVAVSLRFVSASLRVGRVVRRPGSAAVQVGGAAGSLGNAAVGWSSAYRTPGRAALLDDTAALLARIDARRRRRTEEHRGIDASHPGNDASLRPPASFRARHAAVHHPIDDGSARIVTLPRAIASFLDVPFDGRRRRDAIPEPPWSLHETIASPDRPRLSLTERKGRLPEPRPDARGRIATTVIESAGIQVRKVPVHAARVFPAKPAGAPWSAAAPGIDVAATAATLAVPATLRATGAATRLVRARGRGALRGGCAAAEQDEQPEERASTVHDGLHRGDLRDLSAGSTGPRSREPRSARRACDRAGPRSVARRASRGSAASSSRGRRRDYASVAPAER
jgi:hypothetical protein